ncbi:MAG TPA: acetylglutamate kinase [Acidimicrobiales bacterium]|nr:acetylglutamate kinase [Acidimicrobiales bacterium]
MSALTDPDITAAVLAEALPYIRRFWGRVVVVKYGGNAMDDDESLPQFAQDVALMRSVGLHPVVVHGGGPQIGDLMARLGKTPEFRDGLRVTDAETLDIARMVLVGKVNRDIVGAINVHAPIAVGLSGEDAGLIRATIRQADLGFVGDVEAVDASILRKLLAQELIPVVATIASDRSGQAYNINADTAAAEVAAALGAEKLVFLTNVKGVLADPDDPDSLVTRVTVEEVEKMMVDGTLSGGMIPKMEACVTAVRHGVNRAHIIDGRVPHALLLEFFTDQGVGTMVEP